jgi:septal ring factor EnvC (AmiA/AmiB activator)
MSDPNSGWYFAGASTVIATLASVVAFLFKLLESKNSESIKTLEQQIVNQEKRLIESDRKHDECQEDRIRLGQEVSVIREHLGQYIRKHQQPGDTDPGEDLDA